MSEWIIIAYVLSVVAGAFLGAQKNRTASGIIWTLLFSWLGFIVVACLPKIEPELPKGHVGRRPPPPGGAGPRYRVAREGEEIGLLSIAEIRGRIGRGQLSDEDYYFDEQNGDWCLQKSRIS